MRRHAIHLAALALLNGALAVQPPDRDAVMRHAAERVGRLWQLPQAQPAGLVSRSLLNYALTLYGIGTGPGTPSIPKAALSCAVLELDGEDIERGILGGVEPITSAQTSTTAEEPIVVPADHGVYFEAESGRVLPPMERHYDEKASGGKYVWMPGPPGEKGGSVPGSVTWRLRLAQEGEYALWGRVLAPTPEDDSFYVRAFTEARELIPLSAWQTGTHTEWQWAQVQLGERHEPIPLRLPVGEVDLQFRVREDGTKIDRLFITPKADDRPE